MEIVLFPHTHWDREWYLPFQTFRLRLTDVMEKIIPALQSGELDCFYLDGQTVILEDYFELYPDKKPVIEELITEKKLFVGPWYVLADEFLVSGESLIRNLLTGINQAKDYGCGEFFGYLPDSFGHNSQMPKILTSFGLKNAVLWRGVGDKMSEFFWKSDDGSQITATYLTEGYFITENFGEIIEKLKQRSASDQVLLPVGGDHVFVKPEFSTANNNIFTYFKSLEQFRNNFETITGELRDNAINPLLPGTLSSRMYLKQLNATATWKLSRVCEPLQVFLNKNRKKELDYAWKLLLKNHPHDSICGCSVDEVHEENVSRFKQVNQISDALIERCMPAENTDNSTLAVYNLSNYPYTGVVRIKQPVFPRKIMLDTGRAPMCEDMQEEKELLAYVENLPPFSSRCVKPVTPPKPMEITDAIIKSHNLTSRRDVGDTYNFCPAKGDNIEYATLLRTEVIEKSPLRNITRVYYQLEAEITTDIITTSGSKRVEFVTNWANTAKDRILQAEFRLPEKICQTVSEDTFGLIKRNFNPDYRLKDLIPAGKGQELSANTAPMQRFVHAQGMGIITEGLHEYEISGNNLCITLLRSTGKLSKTGHGTRNFPAGPPLDTPGAQCPGKHTVRYAVCAANKPQELFKEADEFMGCTLADFGRVDDRDFLNINNRNILIYGVKFPKNGEGIVIRAVNITEVSQKTCFGCELVETNSLEEASSGVYNINDEIIFKPFELKTLWLKNKH